MNLSDITYEPFNIQWTSFEWRTDSNISASANAWRTLTINTDVANEIDRCVRSGNQITLEPGTYIVTGFKSFQRTSHSRISFYSVTQGKAIVSGVNTYHYTSTSEGYGQCAMQGVFTVTETEVFECRYYTRSNGYHGLGSGNGTFTLDRKLLLTIGRIA